MIRGRIMASAVGTSPHTDSSTRRTCFRCGGERSVNGRTPSTKNFMCGDCKAVDPALARRLGLK